MPSSVAFAAFAAVTVAFTVGMVSLRAQETVKPAAPAVPALASTETDKLLALEGETVRVTGTIENTGKSKSGNQFLNFADSKFVAVTFNSDLGKFPDGEPADLFDGKTVAITGPIKIYKGIPEIILSQPSLIAIIDPTDAVVPAPEPAAEKKEEAPAPPEPEPAPVPEPPKEEVAAPVKTPPVDWRKYFPD